MYFCVYRSTQADHIIVLVPLVSTGTLFDVSNRGAGGFDSVIRYAFPELLELEREHDPHLEDQAKERDLALRHGVLDRLFKIDIYLPNPANS